MIIDWFWRFRYSTYRWMLICLFRTFHSQVIIESKDKYIAKLEAEVTQLRKEVNQLRAMIYETK